ncbi:MAG: HAMP domain-containing protein [Synergistaceae bacterium]|jgi:methyl-accepting chemotaxis protein|nr:HAMP domain-containing protein [Synergistaceae bacterium]
MSYAIWKKALLSAAAPFLAVFLILIIIIAQFAAGGINSQAEMELRNLARLNEVNFLGLVNSVRISLMTAEAELEKIDVSLPDARDRGEGILLSMMENRHIFNAWLAYEPEAFDGRDAEYGADYPGAPSGRYIRSFIRGGGGYETAPDMDESTLDNPAYSIWYTAPRDTGKPHIDLSSNVMYDYKTGEGARNVAAISIPIYKNGAIVGCVGADILFDEMTLEWETHSEVVSTLFKPGFGIIYASDSGDVGKQLGELGLRNAARVEEAFAEEKELYLQRDYSYFLGKDAFIYFKPLFIEGFDELLYICAARPRSSALKTLPFTAPLICALALAPLIFLALCRHITRRVSKPIHDLTSAADGISLGDLSIEIPRLDSNDEIGLMSRSLRRMVEQFKTYKRMRKQGEEMLDVYQALSEAMYNDSGIKEAFISTAREICLFSRSHKAQLVFAENGRYELLSCYVLGTGFVTERGDSAKDYPFLGKIAEALGSKEILSMNEQALARQGMDFTDPATASVRILPIRSGEELRGYFILERKRLAPTGPGDDDRLIFIAETVSRILTQKEKRA